MLLCCVPLADVNEFIKISRRHSHLMEKAIKGGSATKSLENLAGAGHVGEGLSQKYPGIGCHDPLDIDEGISDRGSDSEVDFRVKSLSLHHSKSDPSIYHKCCQLDRHPVGPAQLGLESKIRVGQNRTLSLTEPRSEARTCSPVLGHSVESVPIARQSSTGSEEGRTTSPVNGQSSSSQDTSVEFSLNTNCSVAKEEPTVVFDCSHDGVEQSNSDSEQVEPPSPGERTISDLDFKKDSGEDVCGAGEDWDTETLDVSSSSSADVVMVPQETVRRYFCVVNQEEDILSRQRRKSEFLFWVSIIVLFVFKHWLRVFLLVKR